MALQTITKTHGVKHMTLDEFAVKLLRKIIEAPTESAIERYIAVAVRALGNKNINGYVIQRFIDRVTRYLDEHIPSTAQQQANGQLARKRLLEFRQAIATPTGK